MLYIHTFNLSGDPIHTSVADTYESSPLALTVGKQLDALRRNTGIECIASDGHLCFDAPYPEGFGVFTWGPLMGVYSISPLKDPDLHHFTPSDIIWHISKVANEANLLRVEGAN